MPTNALYLFINRCPGVFKTILQMKKILLFATALLILSSSVSHAQIIAAAGSTGMTISSVHINLSVTGDGQSSLAHCDMNCDGVPDITAKIRKGLAAVCGANSANLIIHNQALELCKDTAGNFTSYFGRPHYFNPGVALVCPNSALWASDTIYTLGDYGGCITCTGPASESNVYIAYRLLGQVGWIKISFDITNTSATTAPISLSMDSVLLPCSTSSVQQNEDKISARLYPNPCSYQTVLYTDKEVYNATLTVLNSLGQTVKQVKNISGQSILLQRDNLPGGIYLLQLSQKNKTIVSHKLLVVDN